jgi:predicted metal-dependent hydrolase
MLSNGILNLLGKKKYTRWDYKKYKENARSLVHKKIAELNAHYGYKVGRVSIRNTKSRWGSCSKQGNLNFNYKILFLPPHIADYIIVHELCHIKEFNHSPNFWNLVAELVPNHKDIREELKQTAWKYR